MKKLLVANRSEIAIRVIRAASELGLNTVAVYSYEDRFSLHRLKADEAYLVGPRQGGEPVRSYLNIPALMDIAVQHGVDAIHPGYGFLSENPDFARACADHGIAFVGPRPEHLDMLGDKTAAKRIATKARVPTVPGSTKALSDPNEVRAEAEKVGYPFILKASFGGGGRGMRVVRKPGELKEKLAEAQREAGAAFGKADVFIERYIERAKHIEVQVLGDHHGHLVHLWERDCSVQRRHQKVVEVAPSINLPYELRKAICDAAVRLCREIGYVCAGTVEFLVDLDTQEFFFIEVNPRVQVEHTVTEMVTEIDIVRSQILITQGFDMHEEPAAVPLQEDIRSNGYALQCRITTEDPENHFIPDYGRLSNYRSPGGFAIRLDAGTAYSGAVITPYFDSLLVKLTTWGSSLEKAVRRMDRALREFRVRGVKTNIPFLDNLVLHPTFLSGDATTTFIDSTPELFHFKPRPDRSAGILSYLGEVIVNGRPDVKGKVDPGKTLPEPTVPDYARTVPPPAGLRDKLLELGPEKFAEWTRGQKKLLLTDTTMRDAHQSLLATRFRSFDLLQVADCVAHLLPDLFSLEMWGGATFDTSMRFLQECPWQRLAQLRKRIPNIPFQMLLRASNAVGYTNYPDNVVREFIRTSAAEGIDVFRIFDSLNWVENMKIAMQAVREETSSICEAAICYTGDMLDPRRSKFNLDYYLKMARELEALGAHIIAIKDMAGLCKPPAAYELVKALRQEVGVPIHFHTHDTSGLNAASILRAADAGVDVADGAVASMSGMTSQPCINSVVAALMHTERETGVSLESLDRLSNYWADVRESYYPFEENIKSPSSEVYQHEMPGGQITNLQQQAASLGLRDRWRDVCEAYAAANQLFGDIVKVTPSSKVVGDMAMFMVHNNLTADDVLNSKLPLSFPKSVVEMMQGMLGRPGEGWPEKIRKIVLDSAGLKGFDHRPGARLEPADFTKTRRELQLKIGDEPSDRDVLSYLLYPQVFLDFAGHREKFSDTSVIPTHAFFYGLQSNEEVTIEVEPGRSLIVSYLTSGDIHEDGTRTVFFEINGQPRSVRVPDHSVEGDLHVHPKAESDNPHHVAASMPGKVSRVNVRKGDEVKQGHGLLSLEAMKMEAAVYAPRDATVAEVLVETGSVVAAGDLLVVLED
ncbi:MAG: pyruvate carboxylase [Thermoguttaceae bacterium]|jgi:pyruvate carboxylase|nr:pyruvate carboxylase [Thermoguttaceae bacterium]